MTLQQIQEVSELVYKVNHGKSRAMFTQGKHSFWISIFRDADGKTIMQNGVETCIQFDDYTSIITELTKMIQKMEA